MTTSTGQWTLGVLVGIPLLALLILIVLGISCVFFAVAHTKRGIPGSSIDVFPWSPTVSWRLWGGVFLILACVISAASVSGYWPLKAEYHQYRPVQGQVATISSRFVGGSTDATDQKFVVTLTGGQQQYGIEDTRAALLKPGDTVHLRCIRVWDYGSNNAGYDCKWGQ